MSKIELTNEERAYIAGFLDGDGSLHVQIVKGKDYKYKHTIRISLVFYQKKVKHWFILWLKSKLHYGYVRINNNMSEYTITGSIAIKEILELLVSHLRLKHELAKFILKIIDVKQIVQTQEDFLDLCRLVDKTAEMTYSKNRVITSLIVESSIKSP